ncbi:DMT family transporter [Limibacillus halophilus]|uniref:Drug/metabolite transporter (DMT)-like permease n=1 Tax=Limibacillus halophilus TaxID=1579333 RepID=A0A839ST06_9PROT|nr:DMT family transporter [Limibacillus halophilus]MBB3064053.1 drug/metabolite transporter (DMT)-like permease [Limibacillus halophilus]
MANLPGGERTKRILGLTAPGLFVLLWSTGFIGAKLGVPYAEPMTFLTLRFVAAGTLLTLLALATGAPWPSSWKALGHIAVVGLLLQAVYLGGVFVAVSRGMPAGPSALIVSLQPLTVALLAGLTLGERVSRRQWLGFVLGVIGVFLVVVEKIDPASLPDQEGFGFVEVGLCALSLLAITASTIYQKRFGMAADLRSGTALQYWVAAVAALFVAWTTEDMRVVWTGEFIFALGWLVLVLSIGAVSLLMFMIRMGEVSKVSSYFYLVPPCTAVIAFLIFGETLGLLALAGMLVAAVGVALVVRRAS